MKRENRQIFSVLSACAALCVAVGAQAGSPAVPKPPKGLPRCEAPLLPAADLARPRGEQLEYEVELLGLSVGKANIVTWGRGQYGGQPVTEYRAWITPDPLVAVVLPVEGQVLALVPDSAATPIRSLTRYAFRGERVEESVDRAAEGRQVTSRRDKNGKAKTVTRSYAVPTLDYLSAFMLLRALPRGASGCTVIYGEQRAYTVWIDQEGTEVLPTSAGPKTFDRVRLRYGWAKSAEVETLRVWLTPGPERLPFVARGASKASPKVRLSGYRLPG